MKLLILSRLLKAISRTLMALVVNGWMLGGYTGAVPTEEYDSFRTEKGT